MTIRADICSLVMRRDGYSKLLDNRWGVFPGRMVGWFYRRRLFQEIY